MTKVAILGGGVGGVTAAFELTATPELRERFDVTLYQLGWRLGGKGASGRNAAAHDRIEEHGLHVWFGFYDHAFRVMRDAYSELGRPAGSPLASFEDAFKGCDQLVLYDLVDGEWHANRIDCPRNVLRPGDVGELPTFWEMAATACGWALAGWRELRDGRDDLPPPSGNGNGLVPDWFEDLASRSGRGAARGPCRHRREAAGPGRAPRRPACALHRSPDRPPRGPPGSARQAPEGIPRVALDLGRRRAHRSRPRAALLLHRGRRRSLDGRRDRRGRRARARVRRHQRRGLGPVAAPPRRQRAHHRPHAGRALARCCARSTTWPSPTRAE